MNARFRPLFRRTSVRLAAVAVLAPALSLGAWAAMPAPAALANSCPGGYFCTWADAGYQNTQWNLNRGGDFWWYVGGAANDKISSYINNNGDYSYIAANCPADSQWTWIGPWARNSNLANSSWPGGGSVNDSISAYARQGLNDVDVDFPAHGDRTHAGC
jgi:hypothetical protein